MRKSARFQLIFLNHYNNRIISHFSRWYKEEVLQMQRMQMQISSQSNRKNNTRIVII